MSERIPIGAAGFFEDYLPVTGEALADGTIGQGAWSTTAIAHAGEMAYLASPTGILRSTTKNTAAADGDVFHGTADMHTFGTAKEGGFGARIRIPTVTGNVLLGNNFRFGLEDSVTATDPAVGIFIKAVNGVLEVQAESANGDRGVSLGGVSTLTSGTTMVINTWHNIDVRWWGENVSSGPKDLVVYVDGQKAAELGDIVIGNVETVEVKPLVHWSGATTADGLEVDQDYFYYWQAR